MTTHYSCMVALHNLLKLQKKKQEKVGNSRNFKVKVGLVGAGTKK